MAKTTDETINEIKTDIVNPITEAEMDKVTKTTAELLADQDKVKVKLFLSVEERKKLEAAGEKANWPYETVQINGHTFQIQKGVTVEVPESVYKVLEDSGII